MTTELPTTDQRAIAERLAQSLANTIQAPTYVVQQGETFLIQDDADLSVYFASVDPAAIVATFQPEPKLPVCEACSTNAYPPSELIADVCIVCANARYFGLHNRFSASRIAATRQSQAIERTAQLNRLCPNCSGAHYGWQCPEVRAALFAPEPAWADPELGRELWRMRWRRYAAFLTLIQSIPSAHLLIYAASYQAFVRSVTPNSDLQINDILKVWARMLGKGNRGPGGAAPAMQVAA